MVDKHPTKKERRYPTLDLTSDQQLNLSTTTPQLEIQSPKTPTLSRKLKAVSLDSEPSKQSPTSLEVSRDVISMPNTPKKQPKPKLLCDFHDNDNNKQEPRSKLTVLSSNLKKFASNNSISGSQTLKTLPEVMTLHDFSDSTTVITTMSNRMTVVIEPVKLRSGKGLLERRGSNASLTIDLGGSNSNIAAEILPRNVTVGGKLNSAKSVSNLFLSSFGSVEKCVCCKMPATMATATNLTASLSTVTNDVKTKIERRKSQEACGNCIIYESVPSRVTTVTGKCTQLPRRCNCSSLRCRRKSLSNENLYVPPCGFCQKGAFKDCLGNDKHCKGYRMAYYPRRPDLEGPQLLSEDFKEQLQNVQYLQTAGNVLTVDELKMACEESRVPKLHSEFWEVPLNIQEKSYVSGTQGQNRYRGVLPNEHSRVRLPDPNGYIHANYIKGPDYAETAYIATQGPMPHTCHDFWDMIWHTNCVLIVMLTGLVEKGRSKCELYFPLGRKCQTINDRSTFYVKTTRQRDRFTFDSRVEDDVELVAFEEVDELEYGQYKIRYLTEETLDECVVRHLELSNNNCQESVRSLRHYWYPNWQDHKLANPQQLLKTALDLLSNLPVAKVTTAINNKERRKSSLEGAGRSAPVVVHCSAGIGRTGCFLAILNGIQQLQTNGNVDVLAILCSLRFQRGGMVQTAEQYELIHRVLKMYVDSVAMATGD